MPRNTTSQSETPTRSRSRGPGRASPSQRSASTDAAADRSPAQSASAAATADAPSSPTYDEIAEAAYQRYLRRGGTDGQDFDDWLEAERELKSRRSS